MIGTAMAPANHRTVARTHPHNSGPIVATGEIMRKRLLFVALIVLAAGCGGDGGGNGSSAPPATQGGGVERIDAAMQDVMRRYSPPGIAVAVVRQGKLVFADAYGSADLGGREPLQPDHLFRVASVSKPISGIAELRAAEDGLLDIEAMAFEILAGYLPPSGADARIGDITVWHLMHHTGGWRLWGYPDDPLFRTREIADDLGVAMPLSPQDLVRWLARPASPGCLERMRSAARRTGITRVACRARPACLRA
jgi:CubicO group peptidase (beta-lactamase class C family)